MNLGHTKSLTGLDACVLLLCSKLCGSIGLRTTANKLRLSAEESAWNLGAYSHQNTEVPTLLKVHSALVSTWLNSKECTQDLLAEEQAAQVEMAELRDSMAKDLAKFQEQTLRLLEEGKWDKLDLPTPDEVSASLQSGETVYIGDHSLCWDGDYLWGTNPYGCDWCFGDNCSAFALTPIMASLAMGEIFGPYPW